MLVLHGWNAVFPPEQAVKSLGMEVFVNRLW